MISLLKVIDDIPNGASPGAFDSATYSISKTEFNKGKSMKIYAEELGGNNFISCNFLTTFKLKE